MLYIVRHGETNWNFKKLIQGQEDIPLNELGVKQALEVSNKLKDISIDLIVCSPLIRARKTAEIINDRNIPVIYKDDLMERNFGNIGGKSIDVFDNYDFWNYEKNESSENVESIQDFFKRIYKVLDEIKLKYKDKDVLIVAHAGVGRIIDCYFNGLEKGLNKELLNNCEYRKYKF